MNKYIFSVNKNIYNSNNITKQRKTTKKKKKIFGINLLANLFKAEVYFSDRNKICDLHFELHTFKPKFGCLHIHGSQVSMTLRAWQIWSKLCSHFASLKWFQATFLLSLISSVVLYIRCNAEEPLKVLKVLFQLSIHSSYHCNSDHQFWNVT